ncbi:hypothetical protein GCM10011487_69650 [Steroidobacter agaridevorans]|uniref:Uncharacterized protein n=1 Tax=Steroidobacter agaridevorans TaxID=2695856 RepID=A0A829YNT3_9GAMM|nr:hypothetical protein GCM10011487_69650 [Steroidobacter agaridevorans]
MRIGLASAGKVKHRAAHIDGGVNGRVGSTSSRASAEAENECGVKDALPSLWVSSARVASLPNAAMKLGTAAQGSLASVGNAIEASYMPSDNFWIVTSLASSGRSASKDCGRPSIGASAHSSKHA